MYRQHEITRDEHDAWWSSVQDCNATLILLYEWHGEARGVVVFSDLTEQFRTGSWAFYSSPQAEKGTGSRMEYLALDYFFDLLDMRKLNCEVLMTNNRVIRLHRRFGFSVEGYFSDHVTIDGSPLDVVRLAHFQARWLAERGTYYAGLEEGGN